MPQLRAACVLLPAVAAPVYYTGSVCNSIALCLLTVVPIVPCRFDRQKLTQKNINNTQYVACMNPTAGSFTINPRLQRLFFTLAVGFPGQDSLMKIYGKFLQVGGASMHVPAAICYTTFPACCHTLQHMA
jgi:hypothetical protein